MSWKCVDACSELERFDYYCYCCCCCCCLIDGCGGSVVGLVGKDYGCSVGVVAAGSDSADAGVLDNY